MQKLVLSIPKVYFKPTFFPIYSLQVPDIYLNYEDFTRSVSDCEELVGVAHRRSKWCDTNLLPLQKSVREVNDERWPLVSSRVFATAKIRTVSTA